MITMGTIEAASADLVEGDRVSYPGGSMQGTIERILDPEVGFSNGGLPMARVMWDSGSSSKVTLKQLVKGKS